MWILLDSKQIKHFISKWSDHTDYYVIYIMVYKFSVHIFNLKVNSQISHLTYFQIQPSQFRWNKRKP